MNLPMGKTLCDVPGCQNEPYIEWESREDGAISGLCLEHVEKLRDRAYESERFNTFYEAFQIAQHLLLPEYAERIYRLTVAKHPGAEGFLIEIWGTDSSVFTVSARGGMKMVRDWLWKPKQAK